MKKNLFLYISIAVASIGAYLYFFTKKGAIKSLNWDESPNFFTTTNGINLYDLGRKVGITMSRNKGLNNNGYSSTKYNQNITNPKVYWAIYNITDDTLIANSKNANTNVYGA